MGPSQPAPSPSAHGDAKLTIHLDGQSDEVELGMSAAWYTSDGECREARLELTGTTDDAWDMLSEATSWLWKRWRKPINAHGPFPA